MFQSHDNFDSKVYSEMCVFLCSFSYSLCFPVEQFPPMQDCRLGMNSLGQNALFESQETETCPCRQAHLPPPISPTQDGALRLV